MPLRSWTGARLVRQGPIAELLAGATLALQIECSEPDRARSLIDATRIGAHIEVGSLGLGISLPAGTTRDVIAEINRVLVEGRISVYCLQEIQASLESWFCRSRVDWGQRNDDTRSSNRAPDKLCRSPRHVTIEVRRYPHGP